MEKNEDNIQRIPRYPLNGRSNYLIDKFYIIGYNQTTIKKYLFSDDEAIKKILLENKNNKENSNDSDLQKFTIEENPILLNEFSSDYEKESMDIDTIIEMILPKKINLYFSEKKNKKGENINNENDMSNNDTSFNEDFFIFEETENINYKKELKSKSYNVIISSNPQAGNNSKKSINGLAYVFYKKLKKEKNYLNKMYSFYIPIIFCTISEYPFYNSFYLLSQKISYLFSTNNNKIPLEIILYNIIKLTPSPLNADIYLSLNSLLNFCLKEENQKEIKEINEIPEEDDLDLIANNKSDKQNDNKNIMLFNSVVTKKEKSEKINISNTNNININNKRKHYEKLKISDYNLIKSHKNLFMKAKSKEVKDDMKEMRFTDIRKLSEKNNLEFEFSKQIKFDFLTGYPLIQYNLAKVLMQTLSPTDVIIIFFYTFLEKDVLFFSKDLEFLSLTINSYLNLNFPLNDEKYYFNNVSVSFDNYVNQNSTFVGSTFTTVIGINDSYNQKYQNSNMNKLKEHLAVDLDNGKIYKVEDKNNKDKSKKNKELFSFIKHICKNKETKSENTILFKEIDYLNTILHGIYSLMNEEEKSQYYNIYKLNSFIAFNDTIKKINIQIQDSFYRLINNISQYFYQNLSIKSEGDDIKLKKNKNNTNIKTAKEEEMNVIFYEDYKDGGVYTKEELLFLDELRETMKFESFVYGFVQTYNPIDLYKIPLTFTEEFISFISRKSIILNKRINFYSLIDELYEVKKRQEINVDLKEILSEFCDNYKIYFNRIIDENEEKKGMNKIKLKIFEEEIIKYRGYELDNNIYMKYLHILSDLNKKEENIFFKYFKNVENNIPKMISVTDIESVIENFAIDTNILSPNDLCCVNIIILFTLSLRYIKSLVECQSFLGTLFQKFIVFRKYFSMIMSMVYSLYEESIKKKDYLRAKDYFYLYYLCINSLRNFKLIPNENLMKIIQKFNKINIDSLNDKNKENIIDDKNNEIVNDSSNNNNKIKLYGIDLPEERITINNLYPIYNFTANGSLSEIELINKINNVNNKSKVINSNPNEFIEPRIRFNNGIHPHESILYSQRIMLSDLVEQYKDFIIDMDEKKLKSKINLDACLNVLLFLRNSKEFEDLGDVVETVEKIFYIFLNQIEIRNNKDK